MKKLQIALEKQKKIITHKKEVKEVSEVGFIE
jgi:hypothetical protein